MLVVLGTLLTSLAIDPAPDLPGELALKSEFLQASLDRAERPARVWYYGWLSAFGAGLAARTTLAFAGPSEGIRIDSQVGMVTLASGMAVMLALAPRTLYAGGTLRDQAGGTPAEQRAKVEFGEELLVRGAAREKLGRSWIPHVAGIALNLGAGAFLAFHEERWTSGIIAAGAGIAVNELKILTQPTTASEALVAYRRLKLPARETAPERELRVPAEPSLALVALPLGLGLAGSF